MPQHPREPERHVIAVPNGQAAAFQAFFEERYSEQYPLSTPISMSEALHADHRQASTLSGYTLFQPQANPAPGYRALLSRIASAANQLQIDATVIEADLTLTPLLLATQITSAVAEAKERHR